MGRAKGVSVVLVGVTLLLLFLVVGVVVYERGWFGPDSPPLASRSAVRLPVSPEIPSAPSSGTGPQKERGDTEDHGPEARWWERHITSVTVRVVRAEDRGPIPGAAVEWTMEGETDRRVQTGADGTVRIEGFPERWFRVVARAPDRVMDWAEISQSDVVSRETWGEDGALLLVLPVGVTLRGLVLSAPDRRPVVRARVSALLGGSLGREYEVAGSDDRLGSVETDAEGRFVTAPVPPEKLVSLVVEHPDFLEADRTLRLPEDSPQSEPLEFLLEPAASVRGIVRDHDGSPAVGAEVWVVPITWVRDEEEEDLLSLRYPEGNRRGDALNRDAGGMAVTAEAGAFVVSGIRPGQVHRVYALVKSSDEVVKRSAVVEVTTPAAGLSATADLRLQTLSRVSVRVEGPDGTAIEKALVTLTPTAGLWPEDDKRYADDGILHFAEVLPGDYRVAVHAEGYENASTTVTVKESGPPPSVIVRIGRGLAIEGILVDDAGNPVPGKEVLAYRLAGDGSDPNAFDESERFRWVKSGLDGRFRIEGLRAGPYSLALAGVSTARLRVEAPASGVRLSTTRPTMAVACLVFPSGTVVPKEVPAGLTTMLDGGGIVSGGNESTFDGKYLRVWQFQAGRNEIEIEIPGWARVVRSFEATAGQTVDLGEILMSPGVTVRGRVVDPLGKPVNGAEVNTEWYIRKPASTDREGRFLLEHMPEGRFLIRIRADGWPDMEVLVEAGPDLQETVVSLVRGGIVRGVLHREDGGAVRGTVCFRTPGNGDRIRHPEASSDEKGRFEIRLQPGSYIVRFWTREGEGQARNVEVQADVEITLDFVVPGK